MADLKAGDKVWWESTPTQRGFVCQRWGIVDQVDKDEGRLRGYVVLVVGTHAYHPENPKEGRDLPTQRGAKEYCDNDEARSGWPESPVTR